MARRKKTTKKRVTRRRSKRMGAVNMAGGLTSALFTIAGGVAARFVANTINGTTLNDSYKKYVASVAPIAVGLFLPKFIKSDIGKSIGNGMIAAGGMGLVSSFLPAIAGVDDMIEFPVQVSGVDDGLSVIAGDDVMAGDDSLSVLAGIDDEYDY